jgi:Asp-tRNA(Asn)/Glu-tRNA(Gln) amidotransferase C subunit
MGKTGGNAMTISIKEVEHVAVLARLQLKENEKEGVMEL